MKTLYFWLTCVVVSVLSVSAIEGLPRDRLGLHLAWLIGIAGGVVVVLVDSREEKR